MDADADAGFFYFCFCFPNYLSLPGQLQAQNREDAGPYLALAQMQGGKCDCHEMMLNHQTIQAIKDKSLRIKELIKEYEEFYEKWLSKVRDVEHDDNGHITPNMV